MGLWHRAPELLHGANVGIDLEATRLCYNLCGRNLNIQRGDMTKGDKEVDRKHTVLDILLNSCSLFFLLLQRKLVYS
ncbi:unnamed protein product [Brassica rapa]|uniref:Uncharacterized protein n=1 Tax=Brassica campestris TaxID=3711 RepID=A0A8D9MED3_BRACM|nr:unnamed protein product [Brassica rapa]